MLLGAAQTPPGLAGGGLRAGVSKATGAFCHGEGEGRPPGVGGGVKDSWGGGSAPSGGEHQGRHGSLPRPLLMPAETAAPRP